MDPPARHRARYSDRRSHGNGGGSLQQVTATGRCWRHCPLTLSSPHVGEKDRKWFLRPPLTSGGGENEPEGKASQGTHQHTSADTALQTGSDSGGLGAHPHRATPAESPQEDQAMAKGTLIAAMNIGQAAEDEFHDWYDTEHVPERQRVPGFLACQRWIGAQDRKISVATYDLETVAVLKSPAYLAIGGENLSPWSKRVTGKVERLMRFEGDQILPGDQLPPEKAGGLLLNAMNIAPEFEAEFNEWYDKEHIPALSAVPGVLFARRFRGNSCNRKDVALYHLDSPEVPDSAEWKKARESDWTSRLQPHFREQLRLVLRRYARGR